MYCRSLLSPHTSLNTFPTCGLIKAVDHSYLFLLYFPYTFCLFSVKVQTCTAHILFSGLCGKLADNRTWIKTHSFSDNCCIQHKQMIATLLSAAYLSISSKLSRITHLFIIIDHWNPSAAFDNSYCRLAELRTWPGVFETVRQES